MNLEDSIHSHRLRVLRDAERLGNVSDACRRHGMSRTVFYRLRRRFAQYGPDGVHPKRRHARCGRPPAIPVQTERRVIAFALAWPTCGPQWYRDQLAREGVRIAPTTVWRLLRRRQLGTRRARLAVLEHGSAETRGILTERTVKSLRHVDADAPGELLSLDTFYGGKLKGVGKVWQITGCDVASSFAWARLVIGEVTAAAVLAFLREDVRPRYRHARLAAAPRAHRQRERIQGRLCPRLSAPGRPGDPHQAASCVDQRLRRAIAEDDLARALAHRVSAAILYRPAIAASRPRSIPAVL